MNKNCRELGCANSTGNKDHKAAQAHTQPLILIAIVILASATLGCALTGGFSSPEEDRAAIRRLPTLTPTVILNGVEITPETMAEPPAANTQQQQAPSDETTKVPTATPAPPIVFTPVVFDTPTSTPSPTLIAVPPSDEFAVAAVSNGANPDGSTSWSLTDVHIVPNQEEEAVHLYGNLINHSNSAQEVVFVTGKFFDAQGQLIADEDSTYDIRPSEVVPAGGYMPFELVVEDIQSVADYQLNVEARPTNETLQTNFDFTERYDLVSEDEYCVGGTLRNVGNAVQDYLLIIAVLYNNQNQVINFGDYYEPAPDYLTGNETLDFEICMAPPGQDVARFELQAWGQ